MRKIYFKIFIGIIIILWIIYFIQILTPITNEGFTPKINSLCRPYIRDINQKYETFVSNYGTNVIINKLRKWKIY
jgi:hypothetical protein